MFTGLITSLGTIRHREERGDLLLEIHPDARDFPLAPGASIACNGICLTVTSITDDHAFTVTLSAETLRCTTAGQWLTGMRLNLEPSLKVGDALGGHFVSGHVDGVARVVAKTPSGDSTVWVFEAASELMRFIAPKGSVALNGVSLTVNAVNGAGESRNGGGSDPSEYFTVNIIPHTATATTFGALSVGDTVNLEVDLLARYVARMNEHRA